MSATAHIPRLVPHPREVYLRQNETRIRSAAASVLASGTPDPAVSAALDAVIFAEDLFDIHEIATEKYISKPHHAQLHRDWAAKAMQLKLRALDQLAHLVI